jgi:hypothetical protein
MKAKYVTAAMRRREELEAKFGGDALVGYAHEYRSFFVPRKDQVGYVILAGRKPYR